MPDASSARSGVTPLLPVTIDPGGIQYAPGIRAGRWIFAPGHKGVAEFGGAMAPEVIDAARKLGGAIGMKVE